MGIRKGPHACNLPFPLFPCNIHTTGEGGREGPTGHSRKCVAVLCCCCSPHVYEHFPFLLPSPPLFHTSCPSSSSSSGQTRGKAKGKAEWREIGSIHPRFSSPPPPDTSPCSEGTAGEKRMRAVTDEEEDARHLSEIGLFLPSIFDACLPTQ